MTAVDLAKRCRRQGARQCLRPSVTLLGPKGQDRHTRPQRNTPMQKNCPIHSTQRVLDAPKLRSPLPDHHQTRAGFDTHAIFEEDVDGTREVVISARACAATCRAEVVKAAGSDTWIRNGSKLMNRLDKCSGDTVFNHETGQWTSFGRSCRH